MKRAITNKEYQAIKEDNYDCLNWENLKKLKFLKEWDHWVIIRPTNGCACKEYNGHKVKSHYLIVPKEDHKDLQDMSMPEIAEWNHINLYLNERFAKRNVYIFWKTRAFRSIDKYHGHLVII